MKRTTACLVFLLALLCGMPQAAGATLRSHLENGAAMAALETGRWDTVVLQEQSLLGGMIVDGTVRLGDTGAFHASVRELVQRVRAAKAAPVLYMTWARRDPAGDRPGMQRRLADACLGIGKQLGVKVAPVGLAWMAALEDRSQPPLYSGDGAHPGPAGSYLSACVLYAAITGRSSLGAAALITGRPVSEDGSVGQTTGAVLVELDVAAAEKLQRIAWRLASHQP